MAEGITFFILVALFPAIASVVSLLGLFAGRATIEQDVNLVSGFLPGGAVSILRAELHHLVSQKASALNLAFLASSAVAIWRASGGFKALVEGLNVAYEVDETRSFIRLKATALLFTLAGVILAAVAIAFGFLISTIPPGLGTNSFLKIVLGFALWVAAFLLCTGVHSALCHFGPSRPPHTWRWVNVGVLLASALRLLGTRLFSFYVENYGSYNRIYGDLGAVVGCLTWVWLSLVFILLGAEINCEIDRLKSISSPVEALHPLTKEMIKVFARERPAIATLGVCSRLVRTSCGGTEAH